MNRGVISESVLLGCKGFFLHLEGLYKTLKDKLTTDMSDVDFLKSVAQCQNDAACNTELEFRNSLAREALTTNVQPEESAWKAKASMTQKISASLQKELLERKVISYYTEWCATDMPTSRGGRFSGLLSDF